MGDVRERKGRKGVSSPGTYARVDISSGGLCASEPERRITLSVEGKSYRITQLSTPDILRPERSILSSTLNSAQAIESLVHAWSIW